MRINFILFVSHYCVALLFTPNNVPIVRNRSPAFTSDLTQIKSDVPEGVPHVEDIF